MKTYTKTLSTLNGVIKKHRVHWRGNRQFVNEIKTNELSRNNVWATVCALELGILEPEILSTQNLPIKSSVTESKLDKNLELDQNVNIIVIHHDHGYAVPVSTGLPESSSSCENSTSNDNTKAKELEKNEEIQQKTERIREVTRISRKRRCNCEKKSYTSKVIKRTRLEVEKSKNLESTKENSNITRPRRKFVGRRVNVPCASIKKNPRRSCKKSRKTISRIKRAKIVKKNIEKNDYEDSVVEEKSCTISRLEIEKSENLESTKENRDTTRSRREFVGRRVNASCVPVEKNPSKNFKKLRKTIFRNKQDVMRKKNISKNDGEDSDIDETLLATIAKKNDTLNDGEDSDIDETLLATIAMKNDTLNDYENSDIEDSLIATIAMKNGTLNDYEDSDINEKSCAVSKVIQRTQLKIEKSNNLKSNKENRDTTRPYQEFTSPRVKESRASIKKKRRRNSKKTISRNKQDIMRKKNISKNDGEDSDIDETLVATIAMKNDTLNDDEDSDIDETLLATIAKKNGTLNDYEDSDINEKSCAVSKVIQRTPNQLKIEKSNNLESNKENRDTTRPHQEFTSPRVKEFRASIKKKRRRNYKRSRKVIRRTKQVKIGKKFVEKNDYEDSDIDESLLVDPSRDLPRLILDTIFPGINLTSPEYNANLELNFETDERLSSTLESLNREMFDKSKTKIAEIANKRSDKNEKFSKIQTRGQSRNTISFEEVSTIKRTKFLPKKQGSTDGATVDNEITAMKDFQKKKQEESTFIDEGIGRITRSSAKKLLEERESANGATIAIDGLISARKNIATIEKDVERQFPIGTLVWGNCQGWWPALIVNGADVGKFSSPGTSWVCWIGDNRISNLRKSKEIKPFSERFQSLVEVLKMNESRNSKSAVKKGKGTRYNICITTLKLINEKILGNKPWTKPHHIWAEKKIMGLKNLDRLIFHPFPPEMEAKLDEFRKQNEGSKESSMKKSSSSASPSFSTSASLANQENDAISKTGKLPLSCQQFGTIAWTKLEDEPWWPGIIVDYRDTDVMQPKFGKQMICRYGDFELSEIGSDSLLKFDLDAARLADYDKNNREDYRRAIVEAAQDFCSRYGYQTLNWTISEIRDWFKKFHEFSINSNSLPGISVDSEKSLKYPRRISEALKKIKGEYIVELAREQIIKKSNCLALAIVEKRKIKDLCLMCLKNFAKDKETIEHPFFCGKLCSGCFESYESMIFACGDDGKSFFCTLCAGSDTLLICDEISCIRVYCMPCMKYIIAPETYDDIVRSETWRCFFCDENSKKLMATGALEIRDDWKKHVSRLIRSNFQSVPNYSENLKNEKTKIRVLSLFDGISAGFVALKQLGVQIEAYFSSEIDPNAEMISLANFGDKITRLGNVREITEEKLLEIGPIDLLIGGSPCNDLSVVNPDRLGLNDPKGTGILFFEYTRIKEILESQNKNGNRLFFWLFENVASMQEQCKNQINQILGREPRKINSANCSPQQRERLYWGNLPPFSFPVSSQDVQHVLAPNRQSLVTKTRTVTSSRYSLMQGTKKIGRQKPIWTNETNEGLEIHEVEEIFGFPKHFTDVGDLCATKRQKLIGKSWSVQTIVELFRPLGHFFETEMND